MEIIKFCSYNDFSYEYKTSKDVFKASLETIRETLDKFLNKKVSFSYRSYYGNVEEVEFWVSSWKEENQYSISNFTVVIESSSSIPEKFFPSLLMMGKKLGLCAPISYQVSH